MPAPELPEVENIESLRKRGFEVVFLSHAHAILNVDFPDVLNELCSVLSKMKIPIEEIIAGGGGEAKNTQRLRKALGQHGWVPVEFKIQKIINGVEREAISHEMDHVRTFENGTIAVETEWNNKDPFYDRDLENFKRLHAEGAISVGIIITRGRTLHSNMRDLVRRFTVERNITDFESLREWGYEPTSKQRAAITKRVTRKRKPLSFPESFISKFVADKFGEATTHWAKLEDRINRGVGNPCPLLLIGLPDNVVTFDEGKKALEEVLEAEKQEEMKEEAKEESEEA